MFGGVGGGRPGKRFAGEDFAPGRNLDVAVTLTITLAEAARGTTTRVRLSTGKDVDVKIPAGLIDGQQIRLKGQGKAAGATVGDALITVTIAPDPVFKIDGSNLRIDLPITLYEAVLGAKVRVPTLDGAVELAIPPGSAGRTFRLKGKGMPAKSGPGDLYATPRIVLPDEPDHELEALMRRWRDAKPYDPRAS
jgi:DnaJ-class molecular chaperone